MAYTWDNAMDEGRRRLALLERALDPGTFRRLETIGVREGWRCLDVGAGGGTTCEWLADRVGATGHVCAVDLDARFLRGLNHPQIEVREEDILTTDLPDGSFDLVHTRWTLMHISARDRVLLKLIALLKPGGTLFLEEADSHPVETLDRTLEAPLGNRRQHDLGIRASPETMAPGVKLLTQLQKIVDLSVVGDDVAAIGRPHRLPPLGRQVDDRKASMAQTYALLDLDPHIFVIGASMRERLDHAQDRLAHLLGARAPGRIDQPSYPAHPAASSS